MLSVGIRYLLVLAAVISCSSLAMSGLPGGQSDEKNGDEGAQAVADAVKPQIEEKLGAAANQVSDFVVEKYKTQVVAGTNYFLKIRTAPGQYIHARVFKSLGAKPKLQLTGMEMGKLLDDQIGFIKPFPGN